MRTLADVAALRSTPELQLSALVAGIASLIGASQAFLGAAENWRASGSPKITHMILGDSHDPAFLQHLGDFGRSFPVTSEPFVNNFLHSGDDFQTRSLAQVHPGNHVEARRAHAPFLNLCEDGRLVDSGISHARVDALGLPDRVFAFSLHRFGDERRMTPVAASIVHLATIEVH